MAELVRRGRYPHQTLFAQWSARDEEAVTAAMRATHVDELADRLVDTLSGGNASGCGSHWPSPGCAVPAVGRADHVLDIAHQVETLRLLDDLRAKGRTIVAVLHELGNAARFATHLIVMKDGQVVATGPPTC